MADNFPLDRIPQGCKHLYGALFAVPFASLRIPDTDEDAKAQSYKFKNPRLNTERGQTELLDKRLSAELRESIKHRTLLNPLVCRWVQEGDKLYPLVVGGDRRYRALDFLIRKKEIVTDPRNVQLNDKGEWVYGQCPADQAYLTVPCQVFAVNNDLDALALSWAENKSRVNLSDGHEVAEVIKLRKFHASDERILEILQQDEKWLAETDALIASLDVDTMADLLESRIDRASAIELANIADLPLRSKIRIAANEAAAEACERKIKRLQRQVETALTQKEIAEGDVADAKFDGDGDATQTAKDAVDEADKKVKRTIKERDETVPVTTVKDVRRAEADSGTAGANGQPRTPRSEEDRPLRTLSSKKISEGLEYIDAIIKNGGKCLDGTFFFPTLDGLKLVRAVLNNNILANEADFAATLRRLSKVQIKPATPTAPIDQ